MRRLFLALTLLLCAPAAAHALPRGWPAGFQIGLASQPGQAAAQRAEAPFGFRYQYLAGGVNTGSGWSRGRLREAGGDSGRAPGAQVVELLGRQLVDLHAE